jgi:uncharacterized protein YdeI (YjbR/CyaY-like superfamily)
MRKDSRIIISFKSDKELEKWLAKKHQTSDGFWMRIYKKDSGVKSIYYPEAVDSALCFGWIDGQKDKYDSKSWLQKFTPRRKKSVWSKTNTNHVARLIKAGRMKPAGLEVVKSAKADGRWENAYHSSNTAVMPEDFLKALEKNKKAKKFYQGLNRANTYAIWYSLHTAKRPETRARRFKLILDMLKKGQKFH